MQTIEAPDDALAELASFSLVKFEVEGARFRVHRLVQEVTRERQTDDERDTSLRSILTVLDHVAVGNPQDVRSWLVLNPLRPHLSAVTAHADQQGIVEPTTKLMNQLGTLLFTKASYREAEPLMTRALAIDEASYGPEHPNVAIRLNNLAQLLQATNRLGDAELLMRRVLAIGEASYGAEHPTVATCLNNLAQLLQATNRLGDAEPLMRRALAIDEASYGPEHPNVAIRLNNLAQLLKATNRLAEAEPLMRRVLLILLVFTQSVGHVHPHLKMAFGNYVSLLEARPLGNAQITQELYGIGAEAGVDFETFRGLLRRFSSNP